jgi:CBS-domain-containing membrane protein
MNIAFFLLPKQEVISMLIQATLRQTLERMEFHRYSAVPIIDQSGYYAGTITEGDLLWYLKNKHISFEETHLHCLNDIPLLLKIKPVNILADMVDLIELAKTQNFVPVVDDIDKFIGIVRRSDIIEYCAKQMFKPTKQA